MDFDKHFVCTISAPRGSGKSHLVKALLKNGMDRPFKHVIVMSPSLELNDDYKDYINNAKYTLISEFTQNDVLDLFDQQADCMRKVRRRERDPAQRHLPPLFCPRTLLILDDCIDSGVLNFKGGLDRIAERGRHCNLSLVISSQRISAISRSVRLNSDYFIIFSPHSIGETEQYLEQFVSRSSRQSMRDAMESIFNVPYQFIVLDNYEKYDNKLKYSDADRWVRGDYTPIVLKPLAKKRTLIEPGSRKKEKIQ